MSQDRYKYFRIEARDILDQLGRGALELERGPAPDAIAGLLRLAHTLKGAARVVRQREIADDAHALEDVLAPYREGGSVPRDGVDQVLALVDDIGRRVAQLGAPAPVPAPGDTPASDTATAAIGSAAEPLPADASQAGPRPAMEDLDALLAGVFEAQVRLGGLRPALVELEQGRPSAALRRLSTGVEQLDRELRQVREAAERMRLTPVGGLFTYLARAVRDAAASIETPVGFAPSGGDVRVDAVVFNVVQGALLHVVRNAVTHGIEPSLAARAAAGKPAEGVVALAVRQRGRLAVFTCTDDGRGIDLDAVRERLARRPATAGAPLPDDAEALLQALLRGGISTSAALTDLAGRGIGLDAVREAAERLGGRVALRTHAGHGTTVELTVPLSVASLPALVVEAAGRTVAIPLDAVARTLRLEREAIVRAEQHDTVLVDGRAIPLAPLARLAIGAGAAGPASPRMSAVVVRGRDGDAAAFSVDRVVGVGSVLLRPLPAYAPARRVIAGAALDAVGEPLLILDPEPLVEEARQASRSADDAAPARPPILVVDDSLTTRMLEQSILESAGYDVDTATSAEEALDKARTARYALFLVDVEMPGMDGFAFVERIRADSALAQVPAILVTSRSAPEDRQRGLAVGAQAYIVKSEFDQGVLLDRIRVLVG